MYTRPVPAQIHQIKQALENLDTVLKEQGCQLVIDREEGVFRVVPDNFFLDPLEENDDKGVDKSEFSTIDTPIQIFDDYYHGIYPKNPEE